MDRITRARIVVGADDLVFGTLTESGKFEDVEMNENGLFVTINGHTVHYGKSVLVAEEREEI